MPATDSKVGEIAKLKNRMLEVEAQLKEERKITAKLKDSSEKKTQQSLVIDSEIAAEVESFKWKRERNLADRKFIEEEAKIKLAELAKKERFLKNAMAEFDFVVYENELLHSHIKEVSNEQLKKLAAQTKQREKKAQRNFDARIEMEDVQRHTIKSFNENYQKEAIIKMELEASQANSENDRIYTEFGHREAKTNMLIKQQQQSYEQLMRLKIERDVVAVSVQYQEKDIEDLTEQNEQLASDLAELCAATQALQNEITDLKLFVSEKDTMVNELAALRGDLKQARLEGKRLYNDVIQMSRKLLNEGMELSKKERVFQSSQIAMRIDGLGTQFEAEGDKDGFPTTAAATAATMEAEHTDKNATTTITTTTHTTTNNANSNSNSNSSVIMPKHTTKNSLLTDYKTTKQLTTTTTTATNNNNNNNQASAIDPDNIWRSNPNNNNNINSSHYTISQHSVAPMTGGQTPVMTREMILTRIKELYNIRKMPDNETTVASPSLPLVSKYKKLPTRNSNIL